ncbi:MAG: alpha/beta hydrolase [Gammaproteobacteria bacterium]|nr:alpha/beta hydrolase [Gammaproteobacteria bacterium]NNC97554.1 alpha/beta hydrolase [Gammaproteobacteria bacterium]NNM12819.1 alpha/beta hydrolase [Gammaproteobacteria bacterium]
MNDKTKLDELTGAFKLQVDSIRESVQDVFSKDKSDDQEAADTAVKKEHVVLVHGLFLHGTATKVMSNWLEKAGYSTSEFSYRSVFEDLDNNAKRLKEYFESLDADVVHAVGHSLGGVLIQHMYDIYDVHKKGRVVALGSPFLGSKVAAYFRQHPLTSAVLGKSIAAVNESQERRWNSHHELGIIAGIKSAGIGNILTRVLKGPNDGTVAVAETRLPGYKEHITVPVSHTQLIFSQRVSEKVINFLKNGSFEDCD